MLDGSFLGGVDATRGRWRDDAAEATGVFAENLWTWRGRDALWCLPHPPFQVGSDARGCDRDGCEPPHRLLGMFLVSPLFGLVADLTGLYGASWLGLAGRAVVGVALGILAHEPGEGAKP